MAKLLAHEFDHETGIVTEVWKDEATGRVHHVNRQDPTTVLEWNKARRDAPQHKDIRHVASLTAVQMSWLETAWTRGEGPPPWSGKEWDAFLRKVLNDPDNKALRVAEGRL